MCVCVFVHVGCADRDEISREREYIRKQSVLIQRVASVAIITRINFTDIISRIFIPRYSWPRV